MRYGHLVMSLFCAWVLWSHVFEPGAEHWDILSALDNREECKQQLRKAMPDANNKNVKIIGDNMYTLEHPEIGHASVFHYCLPDTVDPRTPKASR